MPKDQFDIITIGGITRDLFLKVDDAEILESVSLKNGTQKSLLLPYGSKIPVSEIHTAFGGGAANTAVSFARLGLKVAFCGALGQDDEGEKALAHLKKEKINLALTTRVKKQITGFSVALASFDGQRTILTHAGANQALAPTLLKEDFFRQTQWVYLTSLYGQAEEILKRILRFKQKYHFKIAWNPGSQQIKAGYKTHREFLTQTEILILNKEEAADFTDLPYQEHFYEGIHLLGQRQGILKFTHLLPHYVVDTLKIMQFLIQTGVKLVVITDGQRGAQVYDGKTHYFIPAVNIKPISTLGAGDAFASTFVGGIIHGQNITQALGLANLNAASVVSHFGAQLGLLSYTNLIKKRRSQSGKVVKNSLKC
ncbi:hypothetical protein AUJ78_01785 [Candidatus Peregrinibacteria bacterium CG1_02_41_10]|nr:MAG: hypothetical protein AUJ78_01785 [Candidatus Peregrinibacteria bacterium CG1_02_41_10]